MGWAYNPQTGNYEETPDERSYFDGSGNLVSPEDGGGGGGGGEPSGPPSLAPPGGGGGGGGGGGKSTADMLQELLNNGWGGDAGGTADYNNPDAIRRAYQRTVEGGNAGGGSSGGGYPGAGAGNSYIGGYDWYMGMNSIAVAQAQLDFQKDRMAKVEIRSLDDVMKVQTWLKEYRDAQMALEQKKQAAQEAQFGQTEGRLGREFGVNTQMDIWREQQALAAQNAQHTGLYKPPAANPTLGFDYLAGEYAKDFERYHSRPPTQQETQDQFMWSDRRPGEPQPARPWDYLNRSTDLPQAPRDLGSTPNSQDPGALALNDVRSRVEQQSGRKWSEPEWKSWLTGRFDPEHPHVLSGAVQAGAPLTGSQWARDWDQWRAYLPVGYREQYKVNTGQDVGARPAQAPSAPGRPPQAQPAPGAPPSGGVVTDQPMPPKPRPPIDDGTGYNQDPGGWGLPDMTDGQSQLPHSRGVAGYPDPANPKAPYFPGGPDVGRLPSDNRGGGDDWGFHNWAGGVQQSSTTDDEEQPWQRALARQQQRRTA